MTDAIERELTDGGPVSINLRGTERALAYPLYAVIAYKQRTGDSLFDPEVWARIDLQQDPGRWLACLWAGLHEQQADGTWKAPLTVEELGGLVNFSNAADISTAMVRALTRYMPKKKPDAEKKKDDERPGTATASTSEGSGEDAELATASAGESSSRLLRAS